MDKIKFSFFRNWKSAFWKSLTITLILGVVVIFIWWCIGHFKWIYIFWVLLGDLLVFIWFFWSLIFRPNSNNHINMVYPDWNNKTKGIRLGKNTVWPEQNLNGHAIIIGQTGVGKTNLIYKLIKETDRKVIFINGKYGSGEINQKLCEIGIDNINIDYKSSKFKYNPLKNKSIEQIVSFLMEASDYSQKIENTKSGVDYYLRNEKHALTTYLNLLKHFGTKLSFESILSGLETKNFSKIVAGAPRDIKVDIDFIQENATKEIYVKIKEFMSINCLAKTNEGSSIDELISSEKRVIVFDINTTSSLPGKLLAKMIQYDLKCYKDNAVSNGAKPIMVIMDEFASFAGVYTKDMLEQGRSKNISMVLGLQSPTQLEIVSNQFKSTIFNNASTLFIFKFRDDVDYVCKLLGTKVSYSNRNEANEFLGSKELILNVNEVKTGLSIGECLFVTSRIKDQKTIGPIKLKLDLL